MCECAWVCAHGCVHTPPPNMCMESTALGSRFSPAFYLVLNLGHHTCKPSCRPHLFSPKCKLKILCCTGHGDPCLQPQLVGGRGRRIKNSRVAFAIYSKASLGHMRLRVNKAKTRAPEVVQWWGVWMNASLIPWVWSPGKVEGEHELCSVHTSLSYAIHTTTTSY